MYADLKRITSCLKTLHCLWTVLPMEFKCSTECLARKKIVQVSHMKKMQVFQAEASVWVVPCSLEIIHSRICVILKCSIVKSKEPAAELRSNLLCSTWVLQKERDCWDLSLRECKDSVYIDLATVVEKSKVQKFQQWISWMSLICLWILRLSHFWMLERVYTDVIHYVVWILCSLILHTVEIQAGGMW